MTETQKAETVLRRLTTVASGFVLLAAIGCGVAENEAADPVETTQGAITGGWTTLPLLSGWQAAGGAYAAPAVGTVNGIVVFRGALKATNPNNTNTSKYALTLPTAFRPGDINGDLGASTFEVKIVLNNGNGGTLSYEFAGPNGGKLIITQDGLTDSSGAIPGPDARNLTILDGASVDLTVGAVLASPGWAGDYGFRADAVRRAECLREEGGRFRPFSGLSSKDRSR